MEDNGPAVLCVDDEVSILNALKRLLRREKYRVITANSAQEALDIIEKQKIQVVISDQRMPVMDGVAFLKKVKERHPDIIRITLTGYTDVDSIREAVNQGHIYKFLLKPWNDDNLILEIRQAFQQYDLVAANRNLNRKVMAQNEELRRLNENLEKLVKERTQDLEIRSQVLELEQAVLEGLPQPIMGVSHEEIIVMSNTALKEMFQDRAVFQVGTNIRDVFPEEIGELILQGLGDDAETLSKHFSLAGLAFKLQCIPLSGRFKGQGLILSFSKD